MNCFVIMPFSSEFDDVYTTIKQAVQEVLADAGGKCFRLDEVRPAGRITDRLLAELRGASICVADLTDNKPNVMWELGFAMALNKPAIIVTQKLASLPFDIRDMQSLEYSRNHLRETLGKPLHRVLLDTIASAKASAPTQPAETKANAELIGTLLTEVAQLRQIVGEAVRNWKPADPSVGTRAEVGNLVGNWVNIHSGSHAYMRVVDGELLSPYCYGGNEELTGVYFGWQQVGDYWFARFKWLGRPVAGFAFLKHESIDALTGAWWYGDRNQRPPETPPDADGVPATWKRVQDSAVPRWAQEFLDQHRDKKLRSRLTQA